MIKSDVQDNINLNGIEEDTIGEILNISMGAAATAMSVMFSRQVSITTPHVKVIRTDEFEYKELEPAVGIEIEYINGLNGSNLMIMKVLDAKKIVDLLISGDSSDSEDSEESLNEMQVSALGEIMNQMMGSSSTALATFLKKEIGISTPKLLDIADMNKRVSKSGESSYIVSVNFKFHIEGLIDSEFIIVLPIDFAKALVKQAMGFEDLAVEPDNAPAPEVTGHTQIPKPVFASEFDNDRKAENMKKGSNNMKTQEKPKQTKAVSVMPLQLDTFGDSKRSEEGNGQVNLDLVMSVELNVTVEIGRTKKLVKEILDLCQGSIIDLDKQAGEPVDVFVNGQLIARGDVVVINDNFGVRITEILNSSEII